MTKFVFSLYYFLYFSNSFPLVAGGRCGVMRVFLVGVSWWRQQSGVWSLYKWLTVVPRHGQHHLPRPHQPQHGTSRHVNITGKMK